MKETLTFEQCAQWRLLADRAAEIEHLLGELLVSVAQSSIADEHKPKILDWIARADTFKGLSYFLTPQSEWLGGDSSDSSNFCYRLPHITKTDPFNR